MKKDIVSILSAIAESKAVVELDSVAYNRIGLRTERKDAMLTESESAEVAAKAAACKTARDLKAAIESQQAILDAKKAVEFVREGVCRVAGVAWNESRFNVSLRVEIPGYVKLPESRPAGLPETLAGKSMFRCYTVIRDGNVNVASMAFRELPEELLAELPGEAVEQRGDGTFVLHFDALPIFAGNAGEKKDYFEAWHSLLAAKAAKKVLAALAKPRTAEKSDLEKTYGAEAAEWLKTVGVSDGLFAPAVQKLDAEETYEGRELVTSLGKGWTLPSYAAYLAKVSGGKKLNNGDRLMQRACEDASTLSGEALAEAFGKACREVARLTREVSTRRFGLLGVVVWLDEGTMMQETADFDGTPCECSLTVKTGSFER